MGRIIVMNHLTLDGVMQGPGGPDEDTRGGFTQGGWGQLSATPDDACGKAMGERMAIGGGLAGWLFGRRTYEQLLGYWNTQPDSPFGPMLNNAPKYVVSTTLTDHSRGPIRHCCGAISLTPWARSGRNPTGFSRSWGAVN